MTDRNPYRAERLEAQRALRAAATAAEVAGVVWAASGLLDHRPGDGSVQIFANKCLGGTGRTLRTVDSAEYDAALDVLIEAADAELDEAWGE